MSRQISASNKPILELQLQEYGLNVSGFNSFMENFQNFCVVFKGSMYGTINERIKELFRLYGPKVLQEALLEWILLHPVTQLMPLHNADEIREMNNLIEKVLRLPRLFDQSLIKKILALFDRVCRCNIGGEVKQESRKYVLDMAFRLSRSYLTRFYELRIESRNFNKYLFGIDFVLHQIQQLENLGLLKEVFQMEEESGLEKHLLQCLRGIQLKYEDELKQFNPQKAVITNVLLYVNTINGVLHLMVPNVSSQIILLSDMIRLLSSSDSHAELDFNNQRPLAQVKIFLSNNPHYFREVKNKYSDSNIKETLSFINESMKIVDSAKVDPKKTLEKLLKCQFDEFNFSDCETIEMLTQYHVVKRTLHDHPQGSDLKNELKQVLRQIINDNNELKEVDKTIEQNFHWIKGWNMKSNRCEVIRKDGLIVSIIQSGCRRYRLLNHEQVIPLQTLHEALLYSSN